MRDPDALTPPPQQRRTPERRALEALVPPFLLIGALAAAGLVTFVSVLGEYFPAAAARLGAWQTAIAGLLGFAALAFVNLFNARVAGHRAEERVRSHAIGVAWELKHMADEAATCRRMLETDGAEPAADLIERYLVRMAAFPAPKLFEGDIPSSTAMPGRAVGACTRFHAEIDDRRRDAARRLEAAGADVTAGRARSLAPELGNDFAHGRELALLDAAIERCREARLALDAYVGEDDGAPRPPPETVAPPKK